MVGLIFTSKKERLNQLWLGNLS